MLRHYLVKTLLSEDKRLTINYEVLSYIFKVWLGC